MKEYHDTSKVNCGHCIKYYKQSFIVDIFYAKPEPRRKCCRSNVEIEEKGDPSGGLMFTNLINNLTINNLFNYWMLIASALTLAMIGIWILAYPVSQSE